MPRSISIIEAEKPEEIDAARSLLREYALSLGWDPDSGGWMTEEMAGLPGPYAPPRGALMLAYVDDAPAGVMGLQPVPEDVRVPKTGADTAGELKRLYVRPEQRGQGVARSLMKHSEEEALARGYDSLVLTTNAEMMPLAQSLYDSLGYVPTKPYRSDMLWPDIRWMRLDLSDRAKAAAVSSAHAVTGPAEAPRTILDARRHARRGPRR